MKPYRGIALTIAGSDSSGGAGIQADLKTFEAFDVYGMSVITALTAQNTFEVTGIFPATPEFVELQIRTVFADIVPDAVKTGMLFNTGTIEAVARILKEFEVKNLVIDPVMVAKSGAKLLQDEAINALISKLLPISLVVTPNIPEAEIIAEIKINTKDDLIRAGKEILKKGPKWVLMKGGHAETEEAIDLLISKGSVLEFREKRIHTKNTHGTGCTLSSAITALLAMGYDVPEATLLAKKYIQKALENAPDLGKGHGPLRHKVEIDLEAPSV
ncbi:MAG: bifunctional hydroxymethylpyrimidine kinase/phosphomethylpyrimidine kinase [Candidatus Hydrothermia bacterium]